AGGRVTYIFRGQALGPRRRHRPCRVPGDQTQRQQWKCNSPTCWRAHGGFSRLGFEFIQDNRSGIRIARISARRTWITICKSFAIPRRSRSLKHLLAEFAGAPAGAAEAPGGVSGCGRIDVAKDEVLLVALAADENLAVRIDDIAVAVAHAVIRGDGGI